MPSRTPRPLRPRRSFSGTSGTVRRPHVFAVANPAGIKKILTRLTIFMAIALILVQATLAGDPVQMYLQTVGDAASPALNFAVDSIPVGGPGSDMSVEALEASSGNALPVEAQNQQNGQIFLRPLPARAGIRVWQDDMYLGEIPPGGQTFSVKPGRVTLVAQVPETYQDTGNTTAQNISVEIFYLGKKYTLPLAEGKAFFDVNK